MKVSVIGTGYVGLVTAVCLADKGHEVLGVDEDRLKTDALSRGETVIYEPGVAELLGRNLAAGRLRFTSDLGEGVLASEVLFICVGTPPRPDGSADLSQVERVARLIATHQDGYRLIVEKSTVPVRTSSWIERTMRLYNRQQHPFDVASNPEFTREGTAVRDFLEPDRIVLGVASARAEARLRELYQDFDCPLLVTDVQTAEIIKHASNSFLALKISYINLMADLCEATGANVRTVAEGMGLDQRIGAHFLRAGIGYGGSCFPKDVQAFVRIGRDLGVDMDLLVAVEAINRQRVERVIEKLRQALWVLEGKTIGIWGLAFKPETDDVRGSPAIAIAERLVAEGATVHLYDPQAM
ncbi:MAG: UDP-glucose/GDP-mannose dehydrogenase family protein, partial [Armatimonadetes bacterium]|nr:UDP-glucose/GDP-mannose dehydrogenase family protein [Armatimonadota bacterium]